MKPKMNDEQRMEFHTMKSSLKVPSPWKIRAAWLALACLLVVVLSWGSASGLVWAEETPAVDSGAKAPVTVFTPAELKGTRLNACEAKLADEGSCVEFNAHGQGYAWPGPVWNGNWDLRGYSRVLFDLESLEEADVQFDVRVDSAVGEQGKVTHCYRHFIAPGKNRRVCEVALPRPFPKQLQGKIVGMRGLPGGFRADAEQWNSQDVRAVFLYISHRGVPTRFRLYSVTFVPDDERQTAAWMQMTPEEFFPMIDCYGQFKYEDWPGKIHSDSDFATRVKEEEADLAANPRPADWDEYGGWATGPQLEATGRFRAEKVDGKWWLVTPSGHLFWSHGVNCVGMVGGVSPISKREHYFEGLPAESPFYGTRTETRIGFYADKGEFRTFNWTKANLKRKYGDDFESRFAEVVHQRLASWAMNTIGNWSWEPFYRLNRTPYVVTLYAVGRNIEGSSGYWGKFPDPFDEGFQKAFTETVKKTRDITTSPFCVGVFTNNEMSWGDETSLSRAALASPADQPAKLAFVAYLKEKYETIERLNETWKTQYADWNALIQSTEVPKNPELNPDLETFYTRIAEKYFAVVHETLKAESPGTLDLGCRFAWTCDRAGYAMAKYVDVMSYNRYENDLTAFRLPEGVDLPAIIGEFHFGALDRGVFHTGLRGAKDQQERALKYYRYERSALEHPQIVGTHWFQFGAQPTTGRFDGENFQIGLVDIADTPYVETIQKVREIGRSMYRIRAGQSEE